MKTLLRHQGITRYASSIALLSAMLSCSVSDMQEKRRNGTGVPASTENASQQQQPPVTSNQDAKVMPTDLTATNVEATSSDGQNFNLSLLNPKLKFVSPVILATSLAQQFGINNWRPPASCDKVVDTQFPCQGAEAPYCKKVWNEITANLFCKMGGEGRETRNFAGATFTSGDLVLLWQVGNAICSYNAGDGVNATSVRMGIGPGQTKMQVAQTLASVFHSVLSPEQQTAEKQFIYDTFLFLTGDASGNFSQASEMQTRFTNACLYSVIAQHQWQY